MRNFKKVFILLLISLIFFSTTSLANMSPIAEGDCPYGLHHMVRKGNATIRSTSGSLRYVEWPTFQCSKCSSWFVCEGDPANYGTIGNFFINPPLVQAFATVYVFQTNATPSYKARTPLSGFDFYRSRNPFYS